MRLQHQDATVYVVRALYVLVETKRVRVRILTSSPFLLDIQPDFIVL